jgi:IS1 family transposase
MFQQAVDQLGSPLPFNGFMLLIIGVAIYFAYNKGHLQKLLSFFKKKAVTNTVSDRAEAYKLVLDHIKSVGATKTQVSAVESVSNLILKEQETNGN